MKDVGAIGKGSHNDFQNFDFRGIDAVMNRMHPLMIEHGVYPAPRALSQEIRAITVTGSNGVAKSACHAVLQMQYTFTADDGSFVEVVVPGEAIDYGDKAANKAMSVAYKYAICQLLCIPFDAPDPDGQCYDNPQPAQPNPDSRAGKFLAGESPPATLEVRTQLFNWLKGKAVLAEATPKQSGIVAALVVGLELKGKDMTLKAQADQVWQAVESGCYDMRTGERKAN